MATRIQRKHLSLRGLRTFTRAAHHLSFRTTADELFITASAVSHQIKSLEQEVGAPLFHRDHRAIALTDAGSALYDDVRDLVEQLDSITSAYRDGGFRRALRLSVQPYFASEVLLPNLASFTDDHPAIDLHLDTNDEQPHRHPGGADASVRIFDRAPEGLVSDAFYPLRLVPACTPAVLRRLSSVAKPLTAAFPMIVHSQRRQDWDQWAATAGIALHTPTRLIELNSMVTVVNAACQGIGVALIPMPLSERLFADGTLVRAHANEYATPDRYYFVSSEAASRTKAVRALRTWVLKTFARVA
ncbi:MAG: LysR substrate-binding domain-containing protein [Gammaproteobacteria bacterium]